MPWLLHWPGLQPVLTAITNFDDRDPITINHDFGDRDHDHDHDRKISLLRSRSRSAIMIAMIAINFGDRDHRNRDHAFASIRSVNINDIFNDF